MSPFHFKSFHLYKTLSIFCKYPSITDMATGEGKITTDLWGRGAITGSPKSSEALQEETAQMTNSVVSLDFKVGSKSPGIFIW